MMTGFFNLVKDKMQLSEKNTGDPITMTPDDIIQVHEKCPATKIISVHMDTVNHCFIKRVDLVKALSEKKPALKIQIPDDGTDIK